MKKRLAVILTLFLALEAVSPAFAAELTKNNVDNIAAREEQAAIDYVTGPAAGESSEAGEQQTAEEQQALEAGKPSEVTGKNAPGEAVSQTEAPAGEEEQESLSEEKEEAGTGEEEEQEASSGTETESEPETSAEDSRESEASAEEGQETEAPAVERGEKGIYLGTFTTTGYSNPDGSASADGTMPRAKHTVSTDWNVLPRGSRIRFGDSDIIYTVEDTGVHGNWVDVYYPSHSEAWSHGLVYKEVYLVD